MIQKNKDVRACFAGHWHINDAVTSGNVLYVMTGALREFPYEIRLVEYEEEYFKITTHGLNVPKLRKISFVKEWNNRWVHRTQPPKDTECVPHDQYGDG